jgi:putative ABC transport system permease protein
VRAAGLITPLPLGGNFDQVGIEIEDQPVPDGQEPEADRYVVTPGAQTALGIVLLQGRLLSERDSEDGPLVLLVSESFARRKWPNRDPLGRRVRLPYNPGRDDAPWRAVVGVVKDVRQYGLDREPVPQFYLPHAQYPFTLLTLVAKADGAPDMAELRRVVLSVDPDLAPFDGATLKSVLRESIALRRFAMALLGVFAFLALTLAALGIHGVVGEGVAQRRRELGVRIALGARSGEVIRLVVASGLRPTLWGLGIGIVGAVLGARIARGLLFGISALDPLTYTLVPLVFVAVALAACFVPARRATRVDPLLVLRQD